MGQALDQYAPCWRASPCCLQTRALKVRPRVGLSPGSCVVTLLTSKERQVFPCGHASDRCGLEPFCQLGEYDGRHFTSVGLEVGNIQHVQADARALVLHGHHGEQAR